MEDNIAKTKNVGLAQKQTMQKVVVAQNGKGSGHAQTVSTFSEDLTNGDSGKRTSQEID